MTILYSVYFACHGKNQGHNKLIIEDNAYNRMRCSTIVWHDGMVIGKSSVIGANSLVNKDIPANTVAYEVPVKVARK